MFQVIRPRISGWHLLMAIAMQPVYNEPVKHESAEPKPDEELHRITEMIQDKKRRGEMPPGDFYLRRKKWFEKPRHRPWKTGEWFAFPVETVEEAERVLRMVLDASAVVEGAQAAQAAPVVAHEAVAAATAAHLGSSAGDKIHRGKMPPDSFRIKIRKWWQKPWHPKTGNLVLIPKKRHRFRSVRPCTPIEEAEAREAASAAAD